jgi:hypothetical protein
MIGIFLVFGAIMACLTGTTLVWRDTPLDRIWELNPRAFSQLAPYGKAVGIPFLLLGAVLAVAALGWFKRCLWGWRLAVATIGTQVLGDVANLFLGRIVEGAVGITIAGALLIYLLRPPMHAAFEHHRSR